MKYLITVTEEDKKESLKRRRTDKLYVETCPVAIACQRIIKFPYISVDGENLHLWDKNKGAFKKIVLPDDASLKIAYYDNTGSMPEFSFELEID